MLAVFWHSNDIASEIVHVAAYLLRYKVTSPPHTLESRISAGVCMNDPSLRTDNKTNEEALKLFDALLKTSCTLFSSSMLMDFAGGVQQIIKNPHVRVAF